MVLKLYELKEDHEFRPLVEAFRKGFIDPGHALWPLYTADLKPYNDAHVQEVLEECTQRFIEWHHHDPTSVWVKVVDEDTGEIAAGGRWSIYKTTGGNPYDDFPVFEASWFPGGDLRTVASKLINEFLASAVKHSNFPHAFLNILFTVPKYRRKGAASLVMDWGFDQAKKNDLGVFIEATPEGRPLYMKYGLHALEEQSLTLGELQSLVDGDPALKATVYDNLLPLTWTTMYKPANELR